MSPVAMIAVNTDCNLEVHAVFSGGMSEEDEGR
jgi:hypothetical protein